MSSQLIHHLGIVGVGLIGGSAAAAARSAGLAERITGWGRNRKRLESAIERGLLDAATDSHADLESCDFILVATPVDRIVEDVLALDRCCRQGTIVTDGGSVKGCLCESLRDLKRVEFVGAHPLAGSERSGYEYADADLFRSRVCVLTPDPNTSPRTLEIVSRFWSGLGMQLISMSPEEHDHRLARTSHLPHLMASLLACLVGPDDLPLTAGGFRDTTRIAAGDPELWRAIIAANEVAISKEVDRFSELLRDLRERLEHHDWTGLTEILRLAKKNRDVLDECI